MHNKQIRSPEALIEMLKSWFFTFFLMYHPKNSTHGILNIYEQSVIVMKRKKNNNIVSVEFTLISHML